MESPKATRTPSPKTRSPSAVSSTATSPTQSGVVTPGALLSGYVPQDGWSAVQESVYVIIGHGRYQYRVLLCGVLAACVSLLHMFSDLFLMRPVDHWCRPPDELRDLSADAWKNMSIPVETDGTFSKCTMFHPASQEHPDANRSTVPCRGWDYDIANRADSLTSRFDLVCDRLYLYKVRTIVALIVPGLISPLFGFASDNLGRRPVMLLASFVLLAGAVGSSVTQTITFDVFTRVVIFVGFNGAFLLTFILLYEVTGNARRPLFTLTDTAVGGALVPQIADAISLLEPRWALAQAFLLVPTTMLAFFCCLLGESPAWLIAVRDVGRAEGVVLDAARVNGVDATKASATFRSVRRQLRKIDRTPQTTGAIAVAAEGLLETAKMRRRAASMFFARFTLSVVYYTVVGADRSQGHYWELAATFLLAVCYPAVCWSMVRHGLRETLSALLVMVCVCSVAEALFRGPGFQDSFVDAATKAVLSGTMSVVYCYSAEIFPPRIRGAGVGLCLLCNAGGSVLGITLVALNGRKGGIVLSTVSAAMAALSVWAVQWLPDVYVKIPEPRTSETAMSDEQRKEALKKSLTPMDSQIGRKRRKKSRKSSRKSPT
ncbi:carcinine transporter-like [Amblyomma americanum]